ncbi:MAG: hypothetical protein KAS36_09160, partial [Anaerolineales bacterium]|nr:hypothetical protein [Anaerolineales bacterium]
MGELAAKTSFSREEMDAIAASNAVVDIRDRLIQEEKKKERARERRLSYGLPAERTTPSAPKAGGRTKSLAEQLASATAKKTPRVPDVRQLDIFMDLLETEGPERALRMLSGITGVTGAVGPRTMTQISEVLTGPVRTKKASYGPKDLGLEPFPPRGGSPFQNATEAFQREDMRSYYREIAKMSRITRERVWDHLNIQPVSGEAFTELLKELYSAGGITQPFGPKRFGGMIKKYQDGGKVDTSASDWLRRKLLGEKAAQRIEGAGADQPPPDPRTPLIKYLQDLTETKGFDPMAFLTDKEVAAVVKEFGLNTQKVQDHINQSLTLGLTADDISSMSDETWNNLFRLGGMVGLQSGGLAKKQ